MNRSLFTKVPRKPGVYALCAGSGKNQYVAYVGIAKNLHQRILQHLVRRDSSVVTGVAAVSLNPDKVSEVRWWIFSEKESRYLQEAEIVAFEVLNPVLRSRAPVSAPVEFVAQRDDFKPKMKSLFKGSPSGIVKIISIQELIAKVEHLESIVGEIHKKK